jgi:hypothetical protein
MPDWYVRRNDEGSAFPYAVRLGGCEYSLTEEEWGTLAGAFRAVDSGALIEVQSEGYQDLVIASADKLRQAEALLSLMGIVKPTIGRRGM